MLSWFLEKGNLLQGPIFAAVLFQDDWIIISFGLGRILDIIFDLGNIKVTSSLCGVIMNFITGVQHGKAVVLEDEVPRWVGSCFLFETADVTVYFTSQWNDYRILSFESITGWWLCAIVWKLPLVGHSALTSGSIPLRVLMTNS